MLVGVLLSPAAEQGHGMALIMHHSSVCTSSASSGGFHPAAFRARLLGGKPSTCY